MNNIRKWMTLCEDINNPVPYRIEYPYGRPGDDFRDHAPDYKATAVMYYKNVPTGLVAALPRGNDLRYDIKDLIDSMKENGWVGGRAQDIIVFVETDGKIEIGEGNHRTAAAVEAGIPAVSVQVQYLGRSDENHIIWPFDINNPKIRVIED